MKLAATAARRGHHVTLVERAAELGGQIRYAGLLPHRGLWLSLVDDLATSLVRLGVECRLDTEITATGVSDEDADVTFIATGSSWDTSGYSVFRPESDGISRTPESHVIDPITAIAELTAAVSGS
jgi:NADPH-dependent glutamate synthase beta subunit-like oxidoreductase